MTTSIPPATPYRTGRQSMQLMEQDLKSSQDLQTINEDFESACQKPDDEPTGFKVQEHTETQVVPPTQGQSTISPHRDSVQIDRNSFKTKESISPKKEGKIHHLKSVIKNWWQQIKHK